MLLVLFVLFCFFMMIGAKYKKSGIYTSYLAPEQCNSMKGIFSGIIFFSHMNGYLNITGSMNGIYIFIFSHLGQLMVAIFLFYSGYGIALNYDKKEHYEKNFLKKRFLRTWIHYLTAVFCFGIIDILFDQKYPFFEVMLTFVGWKSIGQSNWFVFDILILYLLSFFAFLLLNRMKKNKRKYCYFALITIEVIVFMAILKIYKESWWYNTLLCFPGGIGYYLICGKIHKRMVEKRFCWGLAMILLSVVFVLFYISRSWVLYCIDALVFCILLVIVNMKFEIKNKYSLWLGEYSFYIYMYMRLPMNLMSYMNINQEYPVVFVIISIVSTLGLAYLAKMLQERMDYVFKLI